MASVSLDYSEYELLKDALEEKTRKIKSLEDTQRVVIKHTDFKIFKEQLADFIEANNNLKDLSDKCTKLKEEDNKLTIGLTYYRLPWYRKIFKRKPKL